jgi:uncharacterized protein (TIGR03382 family)
MKFQKLSLGVAGVMAAFFFSFEAQANSTGQTGHSGKTTAKTCMSGCHGTTPSAAIPTVKLDGPAMLEAGAMGTYTLTITGGAGVKGGMNVAASTGTLGVVNSDLKAQAGEVTHAAAKSFANSVVTFDFTFRAPATAGTATLFAAGNSTNGDGTWDGDRSVTITKDIQVTAVSAPDAGTGNPDAGTGNPGDGDGDDDKGGCSAAGGAPLVALLALLAAAGLRRRSA